MAETNKQKFLILFQIPAAVVADWMNTDPEARRDAEQKMQAAWRQWMDEHGHMIVSSDSGGKTKRVTKDGVADTKNDIMLCAVAQGDSHEAVAKAFENHPHLTIPQASIEIMSLRAMGEM